MSIGHNCYQAALKLHDYLTRTHWRHGLVGPDPGIRFNYRIGRFAKSLLRSIRWKDDLYYLQSQGYWTLATWALFDRLGKEHLRDLAAHTCEYMVARQREDGAWDYPNPEWKGRIATTEGNWASFGLLETYRRTGHKAYLRSAINWHWFLTERIGFQHYGDETSVNYFANGGCMRVPNNSAMTLRLLAELADATGDSSFLRRCTGLMTFLTRAQLPTGEVPYQLAGRVKKTRIHFQCYQYNAFQCLDLMRYYALTQDDRCIPLLRGILRFLAEGVAKDGHALYQCGSRRRAVTYHAAALAAALSMCTQMGMRSYEAIACRAYSYVLGLQRPDGGFPYSRHDYGMLSDQRSYPRYLAMILCHLLLSETAIMTTSKEAPVEAR
jgi:hypothetical protein